MVQILLLDTKFKRLWQVVIASSISFLFFLPAATNMRIFTFSGCGDWRNHDFVIVPHVSIQGLSSFNFSSFTTRRVYFFCLLLLVIDINLRLSRFSVEGDYCVGRVYCWEEDCGTFLTTMFLKTFVRSDGDSGCNLLTLTRFYYKFCTIWSLKSMFTLCFL